MLNSHNGPPKLQPFCTTRVYRNTVRCTTLLEKYNTKIGESKSRRTGAPHRGRATDGHPSLWSPLNWRLRGSREHAYTERSSFLCCAHAVGKPKTRRIHKASSFLAGDPLEDCDRVQPRRIVLSLRSFDCFLTRFGTSSRDADTVKDDRQILLQPHPPFAHQLSLRYFFLPCGNVVTRDFATRSPHQSRRNTPAPLLTLSPKIEVDPPAVNRGNYGVLGRNVKPPTVSAFCKAVHCWMVHSAAKNHPSNDFPKKLLQQEFCVIGFNRGKRRFAGQERDARDTGFRDTEERAASCPAEMRIARVKHQRRPARRDIRKG